MKQTLHKKGGSWGSRLIVAALLLATVFVGLLASTPATAETAFPVPDYGPDPAYDTGTGCDWASAPDCSLDGGGATASPTATAGPTASPTPTAPSTAPSTTSAPQDQYKEVPDTATVSPTATTSPTATVSPTASPTASPSATASPTAATTTEPHEDTAASPNPNSLPETSGFSAATLIILAAFLVLVGSGFAAWRLYKG